MNDKDKTTLILWLLFILVLGSMLPHTAWFFSQNEEIGTFAIVKGWALALGIEIAIGVFAHKLSKHKETKYRNGSGKWWNRFEHHYLNIYAAGLIFALAVSLIANVAHGVEFSQPTLLFIELFREDAAPLAQGIVSGSALPIASIVFSMSLSKLSDAEQEVNPEVATLKQNLSEARGMARKLSNELEAARGVADEAEIYSDMFNDALPTDERISSIRLAFPEWSQARIAAIVGVSPGRVSQVLSKTQATSDGDEE